MRTSTSSMPYWLTPFARFLEDASRETFPAHLDLSLQRRVIAGLELTGLAHVPLCGANDLHQVGARQLVSDHGVDDVVEARLGAGLVADAFEEGERIFDPPPSGGVDGDELSTSGRDLVRIAVPADEALIEAPYLLHERELEVQAGVGDRLSDRAAELHDDRLLDFIESIKRAVQGDASAEEDPTDDEQTYDSIE